MNRKAKGSRNERRSKAILEAMGYHVMKSGGSLGTFDLVGISQSDVILCQVKSNSWPTSLEMEAIKLFPCPKGVRKLVHKWIDRKSLPVVKEIN